jgi:RNA polymerase sigma factor (TIGR02999 family)
MPEASDVTQLLLASRAGESGALDRLMPLMYDELHAMAQARLRAERANHALQATALVNEAWLKLVQQRAQNWANRAHFLAIAATLMRRILVNHAEARRAEKRGGGTPPITLHETAAVLETRAADLLDVDAALKRFAELDPEKARLVELRFFAGLTDEEAAQVLGVSTRTVERHWRLARAWLRRELSPGRSAAE